MKKAASAMSSKSDRSDRIKALRKRVTKDPYDAQAWESLVSEADRARRGPERNAELSAIYEELLAVFPTAVSTLQRDIRPPQCCRRQVASPWPLARSQQFSACLLPATVTGGVLEGVCRS